MKSVSVLLFCLFAPVLASASDCALNLNEGLVEILSQEGTLDSVLCERNVNADLELTVMFHCANGFQSPLIAFVNREQGETSCGVQWFYCDGISFDGYQTPAPVSGKSASEDFAAVRNACSDLL